MNLAEGIHRALGIAGRTFDLELASPETGGIVALLGSTARRSRQQAQSALLYGFPG